MLGTWFGESVFAAAKCVGDLWRFRESVLAVTKRVRVLRRFIELVLTAGKVVGGV